MMITALMVLRTERPREHARAPGSREPSRRRRLGPAGLRSLAHGPLTLLPPSRCYAPAPSDAQSFAFRHGENLPPRPRNRASLLHRSHASKRHATGASSPIEPANGIPSIGPHYALIRVLQATPLSRQPTAADLAPPLCCPIQRRCRMSGRKGRRPAAGVFKRLSRLRSSCHGRLGWMHQWSPLSELRKTIPACLSKR